MELMEMGVHRKDPVKHRRGPQKKYRAIFGWDIPGMHQHGADKRIVAAMRKALCDIAV
jgi:hypothetical protein